MSAVAVEPLLDVRALHAGYGASEVLHGVDLQVGPGEVVALLGRNGMGHDESHRMEALIARLRLHMTVLLIEHDVDAVFRLADRVSVLVSGQVIASGAPAAVRADAGVIEAYLGEE